MEFNLGKELGATEEPSAQRLTLYIPNKDRHGELIEGHQGWCTEAQELLTAIGDGATAFPPVDGTWRKPDGSDLWEQTKIVYTYIDPDKLVLCQTLILGSTPSANRGVLLGFRSLQPEVLGLTQH